MGLKYQMPEVGEVLVEAEIKLYAELEGYEVGRIGNAEEGGMLLTLSETNTPIGMSFLLIEIDSMTFKRVY